MVITRLHAVLLFLTYILGALTFYFAQPLVPTLRPGQKNTAQTKTAAPKSGSTDLPPMKSRPAEPSLDSVLDTISKEPASALSQSTREELYAIEQEIDNLTQKDRDTAAAYESLNEAWEALNSDRIVDAGSLAEKARTLAEHAPMKDEFKKEPTYITRRGDNFWKIARQELDDAKLWYLVWRYNEKKFPDFDLIYSGVELRIPPRDWVPDKKGPPPNWNEPNARLGL